MLRNLIKYVYTYYCYYYSYYYYYYGRDKDGDVRPDVVGMIVLSVVVSELTNCGLH
jgi:hypothetical protein